MPNEKLEQAANRYADLVKRIKDAKRVADKANNEVRELVEAQNRLALSLREFVGANIRRKAVIATSGVVVTIEYVSETSMPAIRVYENGEELW